MVELIKHYLNTYELIQKEFKKPTVKINKEIMHNCISIFYSKILWDDKEYYDYINYHEICDIDKLLKKFKKHIDKYNKDNNIPDIITEFDLLYKEFINCKNNHLNNKIKGYEESIQLCKSRIII